MAFVGKVKTGSTTGRIGSSLYGYCDSPATQVVKQVTGLQDLDALYEGLTIHVAFTNSNTADNPTLSITSASPDVYPLKRYGSTPPGRSVNESWPAGSVLTLTFDGTFWQINDWQPNTTYSNATTDNAGLMSATDKATLNNIRDKRTTSLKFENLSTSAWTADNSTYTNYQFKASLPCPGVTPNHFAEVCFNPDDVLSYVPASVCQTAQDTVYVWVMVNPGQPLTGITVFAVLPDRS